MAHERVIASGVARCRCVLHYDVETTVQRHGSCGFGCAGGTGRTGGDVALAAAGARRTATSRVYTELPKVHLHRTY